MPDTEQAELCGHTNEQHVDMLLREWPEAARMSFTALLMATSAKYVYEHWDEYVAATEFGDATLVLLDKEWYLKNVVAPAVMAGQLLGDVADAGGTIDVGVAVLPA